MAIAHVQTPTAFVGDGTASTFPKAFGSNVTAGNAIIVCTTTPGSLIVDSIADTLSNTYAPIGVGFTNSGIKNEIWAALNVAGGACTVTVTTSGNAECAGTVSEFSGVAASSASDITGGAFGSDATATVSISTSNADDVLIGCMSHASAEVTLTSGSGFSILAESEPAVHMPLHTEYRVVSSTSNWTVDVACGGSVNWKIYAAALKASAGPSLGLSGASATGGVGRMLFVSGTSAGRYVVEATSSDGYLLEDGTGVLMMDGVSDVIVPRTGPTISDAVHRSFSW